jgi:stearoyl-CoA desaturase (delta-9 desaturase)
MALFTVPRIKSIIAWFDSETQSNTQKQGIAWLRIIPFIALHMACFAVLSVGYSHVALLALILTYSLRMFAITGFYHRYFSHKTFKTHAWVETVFAFIGASSAQRGALWWAAHHRKHHRHSDTEHDLHSPRHGFWQSHMAWFLNHKAFATDYTVIQDFAKRKTLRWLNRFDIVAPFSLAVLLYAIGVVLEHVAPQLGTSGPQLLVWGFVLSTVLLFHVTVSINSIAHVWGQRRYATNDDSRNNALLALLTFGEGWHNNHHHYPNSVRQGFFWWEIDMTYWALRLMQLMRLTWDLKPVPVHVLRPST